MMFVGEDKVIGSIGGGEPEYVAICQARECKSLTVNQYVLNNRGENGLDMICGGTIQVMFIPV